MHTPTESVVVTTHGHTVTAGSTSSGDVWVLDQAIHRTHAYIVARYQGGGRNELKRVAAFAATITHGDGFDDGALYRHASEYGRSVGRAWPSQWTCDPVHHSSRDSAGLNRRGRKSTDGAVSVKNYSVSLDAESLDAARALGGGNLSAGIRAALRGVRGSTTISV